MKVYDDLKLMVEDNFVVYKYTDIEKVYIVIPIADRRTIIAPNEDNTVTISYEKLGYIDEYELIEEKTYSEPVKAFTYICRALLV